MTNGGGTETITRLVFRELQKRGIKPVLVLSWNTQEPAWIEEFLFEVLLDHEPEIYRNSMLKQSYLFHRIIAKHKPDIIIPMWPNVLPICLIAAFLHKKVVSIITWFHGDPSGVGKLSIFSIRFANYHLSICNELNKRIIALSNCSAERAVTVYNGVESNKDFIAPADIPTFVYVGRLEYGYGKRVSHLLEALSRLIGDWKAEIIGDGKDGLLLLDYAENLGISNKLTWHGWQEKPWECLESATVLVLPSDYEGFPMILLEAMSRGLPCVSSNCYTGPNEIVVPGVNGYLYDVGDVGQLASFLQKFVDNPKHLNQTSIRESMSIFSIEAVVDRMINVFASAKANFNT